MTGQDFQDRLDAIVEDLQTKGKGQTVKINFRTPDNDALTLPLSSNVQGVVNAVQLAAITNFLTNEEIMLAADEYETLRAPVTAAMEVFRVASEPHLALSDAASVARKNYNDAIAADPNYQAAKTTLDTARSDPDYVAASNGYVQKNVSENFAELQQVKGKYIAV